MRKDYVRRVAELMFRTNRADVDFIAKELQLNESDALRMLQELERRGLVVREGGDFLVAIHEVAGYLLDALQLDCDKFELVVGKAVAMARRTGGYVTFEQVSEWMIGIEKDSEASEQAVVETGSADFDDAVENMLLEISGFDILMERLKTEGVDVIREQDVDRWEEINEGTR